MQKPVFPTIDRQCRPPAPGWPRSRAPLNLVWHHVFPFALLCDIWNALVLGAAQSQEADAFLALRRYMAVCGRELGDIDRWADRARRGNLTVAEADMLASRAVWQPWNIVEGPAAHLRSDDFGDDYIDRFTHGITRAEYQRMLTIEGIFNSVSGLPLGPNPPLPSLRRIGEAFQLARPSLAPVLQPIFFRPGMWVQGPDARWKKRRSGEQFIPG
ncbi:MAG: hypothetical protein KIT83_15865 [Bryobacterales bacterium]|nr:hypothetical protein [Bryobacterales bacterium]